MKSYISRKLPLETRMTDQILDRRSAEIVIGAWIVSQKTKEGQRRRSRLRLYRCRKRRSGGGNDPRGLPARPFNAVLPSLVEQGLVADVQDAGGFLAVPIGLFQGAGNG